MAPGWCKWLLWARDLQQVIVICFVFLDLQFVDFVYPTKIEILETYNPGAVVRILALESVTPAFNKCRLVLVVYCYTVGGKVA